MPGLIIGFEHSFVHTMADFIASLDGDSPAAPTFRDALDTNRVCDAIIASGKAELADPLRTGPPDRARSRPDPRGRMQGVLPDGPGGLQSA